MHIIELRGGEIYDIPCGNNVARSPRKTKHILKLPFAFQPTPLFFDDNAVIITEKTAPGRRPRENSITFGFHLDNGSCTRLNTSSMIRTFAVGKWMTTEKEIM